MPLLTVLALMALPFVEVWLMIAVGGWIGVPWTLAAWSRSWSWAWPCCAGPGPGPSGTRTGPAVG